MAVAMSASSTAGTRYRPVARPRIVWAFIDTMVLARRSLLATLPETTFFSRYRETFAS